MTEKSWQKVTWNKIILAVVLMLVVSCVFLNTGHFSLDKQDKQIEVDIKRETLKEEPVKYKSLSTKINGYMQQINIIEADVSDNRVQIKPVLSFDSLFGFETLSAICSRKNPYGAINAGFFYSYGEPAGMVCIDGKVLTKPTGIYPVFSVENGKAYLRNTNIEMWISSGEKKLPLNNINAPEGRGGVVLYTPEYGGENRVKRKSINVTIRNNIIEKIEQSKGSRPIPRDGMVISLFEPYMYKLDDFLFEVGDKVEFMCNPAVTSKTQAYECGSWLVRDGKLVIGSKDSWIGVTTNREPRTAIGIKNDGKVVLITIDGRQPGYSVGMTGKEMAEYLIQYGVRNAAMLDGGASTEMIVEGKIVNKPSDERERPLAGGIAVYVDK